MTTTVSPVNGVLSLPIHNEVTPPARTGSSPFSSLLTARPAEVPTQPSLYGELQQLSHDLIQSKKMTPQHLILYQLKAYQFGLRVELMSKVAEGLSSSVRKLSAQ